MKTIDINCDLGEGMPWDEALMPYISSANIACGAHAGNEEIIFKTVQLCTQHNVAIGAHPGFADKPGFGRNEMELKDEELYHLIRQQIETVGRICQECNTTLHHVKLHGALYNMAARNRKVSKIASQAVKKVNTRLLFYGLSNSVMLEEARNAGLYTVAEAFADRAYRADGSLLARSNPGAVISEPEKALHQVLQILEHNTVTTVENIKIPLKAETICIHGDEPHAPEIAGKITTALRTKGYRISKPKHSMKT